MSKLHASSPRPLYSCTTSLRERLIAPIPPLLVGLLGGQYVSADESHVEPIRVPHRRKPEQACAVHSRIARGRRRVVRQHAAGGGQLAVHIEHKGHARTRQDLRAEPDILKYGPA